MRSYRLALFFLLLSLGLLLPSGAFGRTHVTPIYAGSAGAAVSGPISATAALNTDTCRGGPVTLTATVQDTYGGGVQGATVTGSVTYRTTGHSFTFPTTDASGSTATRIDTGRPRGGYNVIFTVDAAAGDYTAETQTTCFAP